MKNNEKQRKDDRKTKIIDFLIKILFKKQKKIVVIL